RCIGGRSRTASNTTSSADPRRRFTDATTSERNALTGRMEVARTRRMIVQLSPQGESTHDPALSQPPRHDGPPAPFAVEGFPWTRRVGARMWLRLAEQDSIRCGHFRPFW